MTQSWRVRIYNEGDEQGILELMKLTGIDRANEMWLWEYKNNPFGHFIGVYEYEGRIVGHMALIPTYMKVGDEVVKGSQAVDLVVHPRFRRQGIFLTIGRFLKKQAEKAELDIFYGFPNESAHSGHIKYGWFDVCQVPLLFKPINTRKVALDFVDKHSRISFLNRYKISRSIVRVIAQFTLATVNSLSRMSNRIEDYGSPQNVEIHDIETFDERVDDLWKKVSTACTIAVVRDRKYLNWRYFEKPNSNYKVILAEKNGEILGYIVLLARTEGNLKLGYIVDVFALCSEKSVIRSLISKGIEYLRKENVDLILCWMMKQSRIACVYYKILRCSGFIPYFFQSYPLIALVNSLQISKAVVRNCGNWYVTMGDSDGI